MKYLAAALVVTLVVAQSAHAEEVSPSPYEVRSSAGVKSMFAGSWLTIPSTLSIITSVDVGNFFRIETDLSFFNPIENKLFRPSVSSGAAFKVYGRDSKDSGGLEIVVPAMAEVGLLIGRMFEAGDGYKENVNWLIIGPSTGVDLTWWSTRALGFNASIRASYLFRVDLGSDYVDGYSLYDDTIGIPEIVIAIGIAY